MATDRREVSRNTSRKYAQRNCARQGKTPTPSNKLSRFPAGFIASRCSLLGGLRCGVGQALEDAAGAAGGLRGRRVSAREQELADEVVAECGAEGGNVGAGLGHDGDEGDAHLVGGLFAAADTLGKVAGVARVVSAVVVGV